MHDTFSPGSSFGALRRTRLSPSSGNATTSPNPKVEKQKCNFNCNYYSGNILSQSNSTLKRFSFKTSLYFLQSQSIMHYVFGPMYCIWLWSSWNTFALGGCKLPRLPACEKVILLKAPHLCQAQPHGCSSAGGHGANHPRGWGFVMSCLKNTAAHQPVSGNISLTLVAKCFWFGSAIKGQLSV